MFNYLDHHKILISISKYLAPPNHHPHRPNIPSWKHTHITLESVILNEEISILSVVKTNTDSGLLDQYLADPSTFPPKEGVWKGSGRTKKSQYLVLVWHSHLQNMQGVIGQVK